MAKRKRLTPPDLASTPVTGDEGHELVMRAPISQVAGEAAAQSALDVLSEEVSAARREGRMVQALSLDAIDADHLVRDRMALNEEDMAPLRASLQVRGQQAPIEVVYTGTGRYGLISGYRRLMALRMLFEQTKEGRFATVNALVKPARSVSDSYVAMVEENEIRAGLSFYERARVAREAVRLGIYSDAREAVQTLFAAASAARRSKILSFVRLDETLGGALHFPSSIPERLGLALVSKIETQDTFLARLRDLLRKQAAPTVETERALLERSLKRSGTPVAECASSRQAPEGSQSLMSAQMDAPSIQITEKSGYVALKGPGVTKALVDDLRIWLAQR